MPDNKSLLWKTLRDNKMYSKSETEFNEQFGTPETQALLYKTLNDAKFYNKSENEFKQQFFEVTPEEVSKTTVVQQPAIDPLEQPVGEPEEGPIGTGEIEAQVQETPPAEPTTPNRASSFLGSINQRFYGLPGEILKAVAIGGSKIDTFIEGEEVKTEDNPLYKAGQWYQDRIAEIAPRNKEYQGELQESVGQAIGDLAGLVTGGGAARQVTKAPQMLKMAKQYGLSVVEAAKQLGRGLISPEGIIGATQMGVGEFEQAKQAGTSDEDAFDLFIKNAAVGSVLERIPVQLFWRRLDTATGGGVKTLLKKGFSGGMEEGITEVMQQAYSNKKASEVYDETRSIIDGMGEAGGIGFGLGFVLNAMGVRLRGLKETTTDPKDIEAITQAEELVESKKQEVDNKIDDVEKTQEDAIKEGEITEGDQPQRIETEEGGLPTETGGGDITPEGGEIEAQVTEEVIPEEEVAPEPTKLSPEEIQQLDNLDLKTEEGTFKTKIVGDQVEITAEDGKKTTMSPDKLVENIKDGTYEVTTKKATTDIHPELKVLEGELGRIPKKNEKIYTYDMSGEINVKPIVRKTKIKQLPPESALRKVAADKNEIRDNMKGVYHDAENNLLVSTDGHVLTVIPSKIKGKSRIVGTDGNIINETFPKYKDFIPTDNTHSMKGVDPNEMLNTLRGQVKAGRFTTSGFIPTKVEFDDGRVIVFDPEKMERGIQALVETGTKKIDIEASETNRGIVIKDANNPDKFSLVMPFLFDPDVRVTTKLTDQKFEGDPKEALNKLVKEKQLLEVGDDFDLRQAKKEFTKVSSISESKNPGQINRYNRTKELYEIEKKRVRDRIDFLTKRIKELKGTISETKKPTPKKKAPTKKPQQKAKPPKKEVKPEKKIKRGPFRDRIRKLGEMERDFKANPTQKKYDDILDLHKELWVEGELGEPLSANAQVELGKEIDRVNKMAGDKIKTVDTDKYIDKAEKDLAKPAEPKKAKPKETKPFQDPPYSGKAASPVIGMPTQGKADVKAGDRIAPSPIVKYDDKGRQVRPKTIPQTLKDLQQNINKLNKTVGKLKYTKTPIEGRRGIIGAYSPFHRTIATKAVNDLDTTSHELGHALDETYGLQKDIPEDKFAEINKELEPFSKHGSKPPAGHPNPSEYKLSEGIAEWIRAYLVNPQEAIENAPTFYNWYKSALSPEAHKLVQDFSEDIRILEGASSFDAVNASVETIPETTYAERARATKNELLEALKPQSRNPMDFKLTWLDKLRQRFTDSMRPWESTVKFAANAGNINLNEVLPSNNPLIMARLFSGRNSKIDNFLRKGLVEFNTDMRVIDKKTEGQLNVDFLLKPYANSDRQTFDEEQRKMIAVAISRRTLELPIKFIEKQISDALAAGEIIPSSVLYSKKRFYDKFFERNEALRESIYSENEAYNEEVKIADDKAETKINKAYADKKAKLEKVRRKKQIELDAERQKLYDQKGEMPERKRLTRLSVFEQQSLEAQEAFKKAIDRLELERFKAQQKLQGRTDAKMDKILKSSKLARIKPPAGRSFTGIGGKIRNEQKLAQKTIDDFQRLPEDEQARINEATRRFRVFADGILKYMVDSGRLSQESYDAIKANNEEYFMLQRVLQSDPGESLESPSRPGGKSIGNAKEILYSIGGSSETIKTPYEALIAFAYKSIVESDRNYVLKSYTDFMNEAKREAGPEAGRISKIISPAVKGDKNTVPVFENGERVEYKIHDQDIYNSMTAITSQITGLPDDFFVNVIRFFPRLLRASVTNNPVFAARNLLRDYQTMLVVSDNVKGIKEVIPKRLQRIGSLEPKDAYDVFGAGQGGYHLLNEDFYKRTLEEKAAEIAGKKGNILVKASDFAALAGRSFGQLSGASEKVTRMVEFNNSFRRSKKKGLDNYNAGLKAAFDSRALMDFAVIGDWMNVVNQLIPFTNAKIQGLRIAKRAMLKNPALFALKAGLTIMLPQFLLRSMYSEEEDERYQQLPEYQRNMFWNIPTGEGWLVIPKPHDIAVIATMADMTYDKAMGNKPNYTGFNSALFALMPFSRSDVAGPMGTFVEISANKDFFRDSNIVPAYEDKRALENRNYQMSSRLGKFIGETIGVDPRKVDHFIRGTTSYFGQQAMKLSDMGREDKKQNLSQMTGFFKAEPVYTYRDVKKAQEMAQKYSLETERYYMALRWMIQEYSQLESEPQKKEMSQAIRDYSSDLLELWDSYGIEEEAVGPNKQEFRDAVRKEAEAVMKSPFIKDLKKMREERKETEMAQ